MQSCITVRPTLVERFPSYKNFSPEQWGVIGCSCRELDEDANEAPPEENLGLIAPSQQFTEKGRLSKLSFVPEVIITPKRDVDGANDNDSPPKPTRASIGHIWNGFFYDRFYGIELDLCGRVPNAAYMAEGVLMVAIVDPRIKML